MGENGKDGKVEWKYYSTLELVAKLNTEEDDDKWTAFWVELMKRSLFQEMDETLQEVLEKVEKLEKDLKATLKVLKNHDHLDGSVVVKL